MKREIIEQLPNWVITNIQPAFYDTESKTVIEEVGRLYAKIREIIEILDKELSGQNEKIDDLILNLKTNLQTAINNLIEQLMEEDKITLNLAYNEENEALNIVINKEVSE